MTKISPLRATVLTAVLLLAASCSTDGDNTVTGGLDDDTPSTETPSTETPSDEAPDGDGDELPLGAGPYPVGTVEITITHPDADPLSYLISCLGDTATITPAVPGLNEQTACGALTDPDVRALLHDGPPSDRVCTEIYGGPDEAAINGTLDDQAVDVVIARNNGCGIDDWDVILVDVLPPALGVTG